MQTLLLDKFKKKILKRGLKENPVPVTPRIFIAKCDRGSVNVMVLLVDRKGEEIAYIPSQTLFDGDRLSLPDFRWDLLVVLE